MDSTFIRIDPTNQLKSKVNKSIESLNSVQDDVKLAKIIGDFAPGYIYGNVKIHKPNHPLRPIISQCPTPTYQLAKTINNIITPYMPNNFSIKSSNDFIDILHSNNSNGIIASLDVESLFTNVPVDSTIDIIINHTYNHPTLSPPKIPQNIMRQFLNICTKESPFRCPSGNLYLQVDGVAMGSPLSPTFAGFYMGHLENSVFNGGLCPKPNIYVRYVDDIFMQVTDEAQLLNIKSIFQQQSVLNFTYELNCNNTLPFLDIEVTSNHNGFSTKVYHKPTDFGKCLNFNSECADKYKKSVITNFINRAYKYNQNWEDFHEEIKVIKQTLINNNYTNSIIDHEINRFLDKKYNSSNQPNTSVNIYYSNQMHSNYKLDEKIIKQLIYSNIACAQPHHKPNLIIYYKNKKSSQLIMKNNPSPPTPPMEQKNLIYAFCCDVSPCKATTAYIGLTQTCLSRRIQSHTYKGSIKDHYHETHATKISKEHLTKNTKIIAKAPDRYRLAIKEALLISQHAPIINKQFDDFAHTLKLYRNNKNTEPSIPRSINSFNSSVIDSTERPSIQTTASHSYSTSQPSTINSQTNTLTLSQLEPSFTSTAITPTLSLPPITPTTPSSPINNSNISNNSIESHYTPRHYVSPQINQRIQSLVHNHPPNASTQHTLRPRRRMCYRV